jgi:ketosteroid isomerase-like protein
VQYPEGKVPEVMTRWADSMRRGDVAAELWHEDAEVVNAKGWVVEATYAGREGVRRWWSELQEAFSDLVIEVDGIEQLDKDTFLTTQRLVGRFRTTGIPMDAPWSSLVTLKDGLIIHAEGYLSKRQAREAGNERR